VFSALNDYKVTYELLYEAKSKKHALEQFKEDFFEGETTKEEINTLENWKIDKIDSDSTPLVMISLGDIEGRLQPSRKKISKSDAKEIFDNINSSDWNCESDTFNAFIDNAINEYFVSESN